MTKLTLGIICGVVFGIIAVATMIPLQFTDKKAALTGAFINRFAIGLVIGATNLKYPGWFNGLLWGILLSLPDAIITKAFVPIIAMGAIGGVIIGVVVGKWGM
ncbi:MAG TPA: hypothetical protein VGN86_03585 [Pyrinomonadaceae bacterium]|jgi:hypothetical protein|nr:hypothetical protein [Pyrinomonadaceae bacterium]